MSGVVSAAVHGKASRNSPGSLTPLHLVCSELVNQTNTSLIVDESPFASAVTPVTALGALSSMSPFCAPQGFWSIQMNGAPAESASAQLTLPADARLNVASNQDFSWEAFVMRTRGASGVMCIQHFGGGTGRPVMRLGTGDIFGSFGQYSGKMPIVKFKSNVWVHLALCRVNGVVTYYVDGVAIYQASGNTGSQNFSGTYGVIGNYQGSGSQEMQGLLSNIRICIGSSAYTKEFTPPKSPLTAIANCVLLTGCGPYIKDYSGNNIRITSTGFVRTTPQNPFNNLAKLPPVVSDTGGSYASSPSARLTSAAVSGFAFGTGDFTISAMIYPTNVGNAADRLFTGNNASGVILGCGTGTAATTAWALTYGSTSATNLRFVLSNGTSFVSYEQTDTNTVIVPNSWNHVVVCRSAGTLRMFINGKLVRSVADSTNVSVTGDLGIMAYNGGSSYCGGGHISAIHVLNTALYTSDSGFEIPTAPPAATPNTLLLLNFRTPGIFDKACTNALILRGSAKVSADVAPPYGSTSIYVNSGILLSGPAHHVCFGSNGDFTVQGWVNFTNAAGTLFYFLDARNTNQTTMWNFYRSAANKLVWGFGATARATSTSDIAATNTWYHIAYSRCNSVGRLFINGNLEATVTDGDELSTSMTNAANILSAIVGGGYNNANNMTGHFKGMRVDKYSLYQKSFVPPLAD